MKIVFLASVAGKKQFNSNYQQIVDLCHRLGHRIFDDYVFKFTPDVLAKSTTNHFRENYRIISTEIKKADVLLVEGSKSSLGVGRFISIALQQHKPILVLYTKYIPRTLVGESNRLLTLRKYDKEDLGDLKFKLKEFFKKVNKKKLSYRFDLMMDEDMNLFITSKAKEERISKADYIRRLVAIEMDKIS